MPDLKFTFNRALSRDDESSIIARSHINSTYIFLEELAAGEFGTIYNAAINSLTGEDSNRFFAVKLLCKDGNITKSPNMNQMIDSLEIVKSIDHPNIVSFRECYKNDDKVYTVHEYLSGPDLDQYFIDNQGHMPERKLKSFMFQLLQALACLHSRRIGHFDIKPENCMLMSDDSHIVKLLSFSHAQIVYHGHHCRVNIKNFKFAAPEAVACKYGLEADIWSVGVMMYYFMTAEYPFYDEHDGQLCEMILDGGFDQKKITENSSFTEEVKELVLIDAVKRSKT